MLPGARVWHHSWGIAGQLTGRSKHAQGLPGVHPGGWRWRVSWGMPIALGGYLRGSRCMFVEFELWARFRGALTAQRHLPWQGCAW